MQIEWVKHLTIMGCIHLLTEMALLMWKAILNSLQQQPKMTEERKGIGWSFYFCNAPSAGSVLLLKRNSIISWDSSCNSVSGFWNLCPSFTSSERRVECLLIVAALGCCIITAHSKAFSPMEFVPLHPSQCFHLCESHIIHKDSDIHSQSRLVIQAPSILWCYHLKYVDPEIAEEVKAYWTLEWCFVVSMADTGTSSHGPNITEM